MKNMSARILVISLMLAVVAGAGVSRVHAAKCDLTYANFGQAFVAQYCLKCHGAAKTGWWARNGAPAAVNFDKAEDIAKKKGDIIKMVVDKKSMPPTDPYPAADERAKVKTWLECQS